MNIVAVLELVVAALVLLVGFSQLVIPLWRGTRVFPFFRNEQQLRSELAEAREDIVEAELRREIDQEHGRAGRLRRRPGKPS